MKTGAVCSVQPTPSPPRHAQCVLCTGQAGGQPESPGISHMPCVCPGAAAFVVSWAPGPPELEGQNPSCMERACFNLRLGGERRQGRLTAVFFVGKQETSIPRVHKPSHCHKCGTNYINSELLPCLKNQGYLAFAVIFTKPCEELHKTLQGATAAPVTR